MAEIVTRGAEREHRKFSPSKSERFFNCLGSTNLISRTPSRATSPYAEEGHVAHDVLEAGLQHGDRNVLYAIKHSIHADNPNIKGYTDFHYSVQEALDYIWELMDEVDLMYGDAVMFVERYVEPPSSVAPGETGGFCDICIYTASGRKLWVIDYKHGVGVVKAAEGNTQCKQYGAGFLYGEDSPVRPDMVDVVTLVIVQPRAFHPQGEIREWETTPADLVDYLIELDEVIELNNDPRAPLNPGLSWCQFCEARSSCPALAQSAIASLLNDPNASVQQITEQNLPDVSMLDLGRMAHIMRMKPMIMTWLNGIESHLDELSRVGHDIPGMKRVETRTMRKYNFGLYKDIDDMAVKLAAVIGCRPDEVFKEKELLNVTDMEEKIVSSFKSRVGRGKKKQAAEQAAQMFAWFTIKEPSGNTKLVPLEDRRPAVNKAQSLFSGISGVLPPPTPTEKP